MGRSCEAGRGAAVAEQPSRGAARGAQTPRDKVQRGITISTPCPTPLFRGEGLSPVAGLGCKNAVCDGFPRDRDTVPAELRRGGEAEGLRLLSDSH